MKLCTVGDNCIDYYLPAKEAFPGGNAVNVAVYFKRLGGESSYIGAVGTDDFGRIMIEAMRGKGLDLSHLHVDEGTTAVTTVQMKGGERLLGDYDEGVMEHFALRPEDLDFIAAHDMCMSAFWGHSYHVFPEIKRRGVLTAYDFSTRADHPSVREYLSSIDYAFFSGEGLSEAEAERKMRELQALSGGTVIFTLGEAGSLSYDGQTVRRMGIIPCEVVDTMGAGDSYIAGYLHGVLEGLDPEACMRRGAENSAVTIGYRGAW